MVALATATATQQDSGRNVMTTLKKVTIKLQVTICLLGCSGGAIGNSCQNAAQHQQQQNGSQTCLLA